MEGKLAQWVKVLGQPEFDTCDQHEGRRDSNAKSGPLTLEALSPKRDIYIKPLFSGFGELRTRGMDDTMETLSSRHNRKNAHMNSQRPRQLAQGPLRSKPGGSQP